MSDKQVEKINNYTAALLLNGYSTGGKKQAALRPIIVENQRRIGVLTDKVDALVAKQAPTLTIDYDKLATLVADKLVKGIAITGSLEAKK